MAISRRRFIKATGSILFLTLTSGVLAREGGLEPSVTVERSIKAHFGPGFRVLTQSCQGAQTVATIDHLENLYTVASSDLSRWQILSSSIV